MNLRKIMTSAMILAGALVVACGSDDGTAGTDTIVTDTVTGGFMGQLMDFASKTGRKGVDLVVLNNDTGEPLDPATYPAFKSGDSGVFELPLPPGMMVGFKASGTEDTTAGIPMKFQTTYMFNIPSDAQGKRIYAVNTLTYMTAPSTAGIVVDKTKGILAGTIYWNNPAGTEDFVGCALVKAIPVAGGDAVGDVRYFDPANDLPGVASKAPFTTTGLKGTSRYIIGNLPVGRYKMVVTIDGVQVNTGAAEVQLYAYANSIAISNIYVTDPTDATINPTPDRAECVVDQVDEG
jgi:hypothetical protein